MKYKAESDGFTITLELTQEEMQHLAGDMESLTNEGVYHWGITDDLSANLNKTLKGTK